MEPSGTPGKNVPAPQELAEDYWRLIGRQQDIDRRIGMLKPQEDEWDELWLELETMADAMHTKLNGLANSKAPDLEALAAKAAILQALLQPGEGAGITAVKADIKALARSITVDIAELANR